MSRRYSPEEKQWAADCLRANQGDVNKTSAETGIPVRTLITWRSTISIPAPPPPPPLQQGVSAKSTDPKPEIIDQVLVDLRQRLIDNINALVDSLEAAIDEAPLNQRASALGQLIDRLMKLSEKLPQPDKPQQKIRIEFVDEKGIVHETLPESEEDFDE